MATQHTPTPPDDEREDRVIDAAPDPQVERIDELTARSSSDAAFAELEADFARQEKDYSEQLAGEGRKDEADLYAHDAFDHLKDAKRVMIHANEEESEAERLRQQQQTRLSTALQTMPDQQLVTLRNAVQTVRLAVEDVTPRDVHLMRKTAIANNLPIDEEQIEVWRTTAISTAIRIEVILRDPDGARRNALQLVRDLSTFAAVAVELAKLAPQLMKVLEQFGHLLMQFHL